MNSPYSIAMVESMVIVFVGMIAFYVGGVLGTSVVSFITLWYVLSIAHSH